MAEPNIVFKRDVVVVGGGGHVGLPLAIMLAEHGMSTTVYDISESAVDHVRRAKLPFLEPGAEPILERVVNSGMLNATTDPSCVSGAETVIVVIGTPVDEHLNPDPSAIPDALEYTRPYLRDGQLLVLRSTVYPGVTTLVEDMLAKYGLNIDVAFCPERIAEHRAVEELVSLPQIVSSHTESGYNRAAAVFSRLAKEIVRLEPEEAELAKLFTNTWRYIKFAAANQFFMMANDRGLDFDKIRYGISYEYPRAADMPGAGFAAGPCLFKDTMQLAAFSDNTFSLGHSAMLVNEGLPMYVVTQLEKEMDLKNLKVGILGMAFKGGSDDIRSSLSYKLKRVLRFKASEVLCTDPWVTEQTDATLLPLEKVVEEADVLIIATPHPEYRGLKTHKRVVDIWNLLGNGARV